MSLAGRSSGWFRRACLRRACQPRVHHVAQSAASYELRRADSQRRGKSVFSPLSSSESSVHSFSLLKWTTGD